MIPFNGKHHPPSRCQVLERSIQVNLPRPMCPSAPTPLGAAHHSWTLPLKSESGAFKSITGQTGAILL